MAKKVSRKAKAAPAATGRQRYEQQVQSILLELERMSTRRDRDNLARFGIDAPRAFGVSMANIQGLARRVGRSHELAAALWETGWYEARLLTAFVDEPARVTAAQMDRWCRDFDNWGICDTICFKLFDQTPHAWAKVAEWRDRRGEFARRAAFALLASLAGHDKQARDEQFIEGLSYIESAAADERHFVKKGVNWALRRIGGRSAALNEAAVAVARRLANAPEPSARWIGNNALAELTNAVTARRVAAASKRDRTRR
jgi:3-methyladenine DNA glycosylase AlkD